MKKDKKPNINQLLLSVSLVALGITAPSFTSYAAQCTGTESRTITCRNHLGATVADALCNDSRVVSKPTPASQSCTYYCPPPPPPPPYYSGDGGDGGGDGGGCCDTTGDGRNDNTQGKGDQGYGPSDGKGQTGGGGGGGGGGGKVLCGHFFTRGILSASTYQGDRIFASTQVNEATKRGYRLWAVPLTHYLNEHPGGIVEKAVKPFVIGWAKEMAYRTGYSPKGHWLGKIEIIIVEPVVNFIGLFVQDTNWSHLTSEQAIGAEKNQFQNDPTAMVNI